MKLNSEFFDICSRWGNLKLLHLFLRTIVDCSFLVTYFQGTPCRKFRWVYFQSTSFNRGPNMLNPILFQHWFNRKHTCFKNQQIPQALYTHEDVTLSYSHYKPDHFLPGYAKNQRLSSQNFKVPNLIRRWIFYFVKLLLQ